MDLGAGADWLWRGLDRGLAAHAPGRGCLLIDRDARFAAEDNAMKSHKPARKSDSRRIDAGSRVGPDSRADGPRRKDAPAPPNKATQNVGSDKARAAAVEPWPRHATALALAGLAAILLALFGGVLWSSKLVLGEQTADMGVQFYAWRAFGFGELARGHLPLWNPYIYAGEPFLGGMQSALLYPPNALFLFLPTTLAVNWSYALNMWLMGATMLAWGRVRGLRAGAAFFAGALAMLCGANVAHIYAGHPSYGSTMAWAPLIFLAIDGWLDRRRAAWLLAGMGGVAMQILAGHGQYIFYTGIAAVLYALLRWAQSKRRLGGALGLLAIYPGGVALAAVQLLAAMQATAESTRNAALPWSFVSVFGFPPENLLTLVAPNVFGPMSNYWGGCLLWEVEVFVGVTGVAMALRAALGGGRERALPLVATMLLLLILALGAHTPLLWLLYRHVPGFNIFRGLSKFVFPASMFLVLLAGMGMDKALRGERPSRLDWTIVATLVAALGAGWLWAWLAPSSHWQALMLWIFQRGDSCLPQKNYFDPAFASVARKGTTTSLLLATVAGACLLALLALSRWRPRAAWGLVVLGILDGFVFARGTLEKFDPTVLAPPKLKQFLQKNLGDARVLNLKQTSRNAAMLMGVQDAWGGDPCVTRRYAEFMTWTQGGDPDKATQELEISHIGPLFALTRLRYVLPPSDANPLESPYKPLPRVLVAPAWRVLPGRDAIFAAMLGKGFAPWREALLEHDPGLGGASAPLTPGASVGSARVVAETTDSLTIEAETTRPAILTITDAWAQSWRARALPGSSQASYRLIPTDYWMRGVPLAPGRHKLIVEYAPRAFVVGAWISTLALIGYGAAWIVALRRMRREKAFIAGQGPAIPAAAPTSAAGPLDRSSNPSK
jgi:hypothetical protein